MKEAAQFFLDYLVSDGKGHLVTGPSLSPENAYRLPSGERAFSPWDRRWTLRYFTEFFGRLIQTSETLGIEPEFRAKIAAARDKLVPLRIGKHGQIQEWLEDYDEVEPGHRHMSHLFALFPGSDHAPEDAGAG